MIVRRSDNLKGFATITTVLILCIVSAAILSTVLIVSIEQGVTHKAVRDSMYARHLAESCAEVAVSKVKADLTYTGNENLTIGNGTCKIEIISGSGNTNRTILTTATYNQATRKVRVIIATVNPLSVITTWEDY
ncbi:MAG: hypothetical protein WCJ58_01490 [bacterium]